MIKTTNYNQQEIIRDIIDLHLPAGESIELDPTYSKGSFYKNGIIKEPKEKYDLFPQTSDTKQCRAENLPFAKNSISSIMFDPPFIVGHTKSNPTGIIGKRFHGFDNISNLWEWYGDCLYKFKQILKPNGILIFKCQDTVSSGEQFLSHVYIINKAEEMGFYTKDMFILLAKNRIIGHNHKNQKHARKFHSYFLVFVKKGEKCK